MQKIYLVCNAHLDPVWLWEREEGIGEALATFRIAADFCEREQNFVFNHNEAVLYEWVEQYEPELFERIKRLVLQGKWVVMGGWYLQPDCNMPSGESIIRQIRAGREYFTSKFGKDFEFKTALNFDSFGHNRGLVQILTKAGYAYYIGSRPGQADCPLPSDDFIWVGHDGSELKAHRCRAGYGHQKGQILNKIMSVVNSNPDRENLIVLWGIGNHGGGPSKEDIHSLNLLQQGIIDDSYEVGTTGSIAGVEAKEEKANDINSLLNDKEFIHASLDEYFKSADQSGYFKDRVEKSLLSWGVGCYTTQVRIKQGYRALETGLSMAEKMATQADIYVADFTYPKDRLDIAEKDLLFTQFHDILPGSSIKPAEEASIRMLQHGIEETNEIKVRAFFALSQGMEYSDRGDEIPILVYNPHPVTINTVISCELQKAEQNWKDGEYSNPVIYLGDKRMDSQPEKEDSNINLDWRKKVSFRAELPPMQMTKYVARFEIIKNRRVEELPIRDGAYVFDNGTLYVEIDLKSGLVRRCAVDGEDYITSPAFVPKVYDDDDDPWAMRVMSFQKHLADFRLMSKEDLKAFSGKSYDDNQIEGIYSKDNAKASVRVIENGEVRTVVEAVFEYNKSVIHQCYILPKKGTEIEVKLTSWWLEASKMLKLCMPVAEKDCAYYGQGMYANDLLDSTGLETVAQQWTAATFGDRAVLCANKGTYGSSFVDSEMQLTLQRSPAYSAHPIHDRFYITHDRLSAHNDMGERSFSFKFVFGKRENILNRADGIAQEYNEPPMVVSFYPSGSGEKALPLITLNNDAVTLSALRKTGEHSYEYRLFNGSSKEQTVTVKFPYLNIEKSVTLAKNVFESFAFNANIT